MSAYGRPQSTEEKTYPGTQERLNKNKCYLYKVIVFNEMPSSWNVILNSLGFWIAWNGFQILRGGFRIPEPAIRNSFFADRVGGRGKGGRRTAWSQLFDSTCWILDSLLVELGFRIPRAESRIPSPRIPDSTIKISRISESGLPYQNENQINSRWSILQDIHKNWSYFIKQMCAWSWMVVKNRPNFSPVSW